VAAAPVPNKVLPRAKPDTRDWKEDKKERENIRRETESAKRQARERDPRPNPKTRQVIIRHFNHLTI
jgi:hypothetical protein